MTIPSSFESELLRGVLSTTAHDLGGLASALSLRADVLERDAVSDGSTALRRIADELRTLSSDVRAFRSAEGGDTLSPTRPGSLVHWLARLGRYGRPVLPRGSTLDGEAPDAMVESAAALELTYIALAVLHQIASVSAERVAVQVQVQVQNAMVVVSIAASTSGEQLQLPGESSGAWWQWAVARATASAIPMVVVDGCVRLTVPLLQRA